MGYITRSGAKGGRVAGVAAGQHGVVSRQQLRALGFTDASTAKAVEAGRLHPVVRGVFAVGHPHITEQGRVLAAVLACGCGTVASHRTAAALFGLLERSPAVIEVIAPRQSGRGIAGIRRHYVALPVNDEVGALGGIPCTGPSRTLVDLAGIFSTRSLRKAVEQAAVLDLLDPPAVVRVLARGRRRGAPALRAILTDWQETAPTAGAQQRHLRSALEARLLALIVAGGLPTPLCNQAIEAEGSRYEVDFLWSEQRLVVETDGGRYHHNSAAFERDRLRDRNLHLGGYRVVRVTWTQVDGEPEGVISSIRRLLADR